MTEIGLKSRIFLSYPHADRVWAETFAGTLKARGIEVWTGDEKLSNGSRLPESLLRGLKGSDVVVILFDAETLQNPNALFELGAAMAGNKAVVAVVPPGMNARRLPVPLQRVAFLAKDSPTTTATALVDKLLWSPSSEFGSNSREVL